MARRLEAFDRAQERQEKMFRDEFSRNREESSGWAEAQREELAGSLKNVSDTTLKSLTEISGMLRAQLDQVTRQARRLTVLRPRAPAPVPYGRRGKAVAAPGQR